MRETERDRLRALGLNISYYRRLKGYSQVRCAELVGISRTHMSRIENADCAVSLDILFRICDVLEISPSRMFDFGK
ncbi:MAG: helix-turn-helix transcriptional regulator [Lachnospiraceae bacterium]|nr:helix-turn-helix transcriptional regulator [Lachnospiraceae bacterium]